VAFAGSVAHVRRDRVVISDRPGQPVLHPVRVTSPGNYDCLADWHDSWNELRPFSLIVAIDSVNWLDHPPVGARCQ
jgi:hypothetical protein